MGYALKINSVDFSSVAVGQVTYIEAVPCTDITLSANTATFDTYMATQTITATLTPANTTDTLTWSSSDTRVATVDEGTITIHGIGTATITATCGSVTATVSVSATSLKITDIVFLSGYYSDSRASYGSAKLEAVSNVCSVNMAYNASAPSVYHYDNSTDCQPFPVPYGASTAKIIMSDASSVYGYVVFYDMENPVTYQNTEYASYTEKIAKTYKNGFAVSYGQLFGTQAGTSTSLNMASYVLFE